jgi:hypothetical protein
VKKLIAGIVLGAALGGGGMWWLTRAPAGHEDDTKHEDEAQPSFVQHTTNGEVLLKLDAATQTRMGLKLAALAPARLEREAKAFGRVLDPAPLAALVTEAATLQTALSASSNEYARLRLLRSQTQNASARALEAAEAAMTQQQLQLASVAQRLRLGWGEKIASAADLGALARDLVALESAIVRVDLPIGGALAAAPTAGRLAAVASPDDPVEAQYLGAAPVVDERMQGQGFLFRLDGRHVAPGTAMIAWLAVPGEARSGVLLPREGILRHEGGVFVYAHTAGDSFRRREVQIERPLPGGWFVEEGLKPGDEVVVAGAQLLLSEELKPAWAE